MNVTFIVHYFPPLNSTGARRVEAFAKYLTSFGHEVSVVTTAKHTYDGDLTEPIPTQSQLFEVGNKQEVSPSHRESSRTGLTQKIITLRRQLTSVFGQLIDHRLIFAFSFLRPKMNPDLRQIIDDSDVLVSSCPPWPVHLASYFVSMRFHKPWVADYRDQFSGNHVFTGNRVSAWLERKLERFMLRKASLVTVVSEPMARYYRDFNPRVETIENGYDADQFIVPRRNAPPRAAQHVVIRHMGKITDDRIPRATLGALLSLSEKDRRRVRIEFYGDWLNLDTILAKEWPHLRHNVVLRPSVSHHQSINLMCHANALLLKETSSASTLSSQGVLTTKLFEYLASGRPIMAEVSPDTLIGQVLAESRQALVVSLSAECQAMALRRLIHGSVQMSANTDYIRSFSRENQTRRLERLLLAVVLKDQPSEGTGVQNHE